MFHHGEDEIIITKSNSKVFWKTGYQNFFNYGESKGVETKQL